METREIRVSVPDYLYEESVRMAELGLFRDLSELVSAGLRRELREAQELLAMEPEEWEEGLAHLRARIQERKTQYGSQGNSEEESLEELRALRREIWEKEYGPRYTFGARQ